MKHLGTKTLESKRLLLRRFCIEDAAAMFANWAGDTQVTKYLMWPTHGSVEDSERILNEWIPQYKNADFYQWAIVLKKSDAKPIGSIGVVLQNPAAQLVHIGYCIGQKWWRMGITSEALTMLIRYFFEEVGLNRVEARHDPRNIHSGQVMKKCGLVYEGTLREGDHNNQGICDAAMYGILAKDYFSAQEGKND